MNKINKKYKDGLSKKTVQELIEIILRKDDKECKKNKLIHTLENKINGLKNLIEFNNEENKTQTKEITDLKSKVFHITTERDNLTESYNLYRKQNVILRIIVSILGAAVIIESLILKFL